MLEFQQIAWDDRLEDDCRHLLRLAVREDLDRYHDWTTLALVDPSASGTASMVCREAGVVAGLVALEIILSEMGLDAELTLRAQDGQAVAAGQRIADLSGPARHLLTAERLLLNLVCRLSGIATLTAQFVQAVDGCPARIYDTRKTTPGWRRLEKYAVRCGGGCNHRTGLFDAVLIKDNHLAVGDWSPQDAVNRCRQFLREALESPRQHDEIIVEIEVDTLAQLQNVLPAKPDIVLLDNMSVEQLREAVTLRDQIARQVQLEASGGIRLDTIRGIARSGVDRISVGALTHAAVWLDIGLDWVD
jgi:nicotinate-nucleotide pyrophosphorylase (carboxylating)